MIGDIVNVYPSNLPIHIAAVHNRKVAYHYVEHRLEWVRESLLRPIPLTPEILEKNFEKKALWGIYDDYYDFTIREWDGMFIVNYHYCEIPMPDTQIVGISWVHELQHALKLCGIEKEIII